jgi:iron complex transport system substrate-binding protein
MRIVSLLPTGTDIVAALGLEGQLVGVSHACDHPIARGKPVLTRLRGVGATGETAPAEIDIQVSEAVATGMSLYELNAAQLKALRPDIVISQDVCGVCAVDEAAVSGSLPDFAQLVTLKATSLEGLYDDLERIGEATGTQCWSREAAQAVKDRIEAVRQRTGSLRPRRVLALEWGDPPYLGGHWVPQLIEAAGAVHVLGRATEPSRRATWEAIAEADPDMIVFMPCGYTLDQAVDEARRLIQRPEVASLRAVRDGQFWATNATALFSRLTPRAAVAVETLAGIFHPEAWIAPDPKEACRVPG